MAALCLLAAVAAYSLLSGVPRPQNSKEGVRFVGSSACSPCHEALTREFKRTGHFRSLLEGHSQNLASGPLKKAGVEVELPQRSYVYELRQQAEKILFLARPSYVETAAHTVGVRYLLGSGKRGQGLLARVESSGDLVQLPVSYYAEQKVWALSPGQEPYASQDPLMFRQVSKECLRCHTTRPNLVEVAAVEGVSCESCHGPGGLHVARWKGQEQQVTAITRADPTIVNPARLSRERAEEICATCHSKQLEPVSDRFHGYRPGLPLKQFYQQGPGAPGEQHSESESLKASVCFKKSEGRLGCSTCHTPHKPAVGIAEFDAACVRCHQPQSCPEVKARGVVAQASGCVNCHMPQTEPWTHATFRDHRIRRIASPARGGPPVQAAPGKAH